MNDMIQKYRDYVYGRHERYNTRRTYTVHPKVMLDHIKKPLPEIAQNDIDTYLQYCFSRWKHNGNAIRFWSIRQFLKWANRNDLQMPKVNPRDAGKQSLSEFETEKLLETIPTMPILHQLLFYLEYDAIRRPSEIMNLKVSDRYEDILRYDGKTGIKRCVMTHRLQDAWDEYLKIRPMPQTEEDGRYLILGDYGQFKGQRLKTMYPITRRIKELAMYAKIEIPQNETPTNYLIKRTSISRQLKECHDPKIIQLQAGHTKLETTMKYNRIHEDDIKNYLEIFEDKRKRIKPKTQITTDKSFLLPGDLPQTLKDKNVGELDENNTSFTFSFSSFFVKKNMNVTYVTNMRVVSTNKSELIEYSSLFYETTLFTNNLEGEARSSGQIDQISWEEDR